MTIGSVRTLYKTLYRDNNSTLPTSDLNQR